MSKTIAAVATGPAAGPIGIIRVSGPQTLAIVDTIFTPQGGGALSERPNRLLTYGALHSRDGKVIDHCLCCVMHAPNSYTGEDMAEIQCHGSPAVLSETLSALFAKGAVQAEPGEFTRRAFLAGKMDLSGAEAVHDLVTAVTTQAAENAAAQLDGVVGTHIFEIRQQLVDLVAEFLAVVDYPDEEIDSHLFDSACEILHRATSELYDMAETYERGRILREGIPCAILGRPNAGKSSLLNALAGVDRAIVTNIPGTTRDVIEETIRIGAVVLRLYDTAELGRQIALVEDGNRPFAVCARNNHQIIIGDMVTGIKHGENQRRRLRLLHRTVNAHLFHRILRIAQACGTTTSCPSAPKPARDCRNCMI